MLAKGWLLGIQFEELFQNRLFYDMASHANEMAVSYTHLPLAAKSVFFENPVFLPDSLIADSGQLHANLLNNLNNNYQNCYRQKHHI